MWRGAPRCVERALGDARLVVSLEACVAWIVFVPPIATLVANRPMVNTNQSTNTGQRWRALQVAMRTVAGLPERSVSLVADI